MAHPETQEEHSYDFAVIGAGVAGICAAISAARLGLKVALVNDRPVLGGNSSTEVRVHVGGADHDFRWARESGVIEEIRIEDRFRNYSPVVSGAINHTWNAVLWELVTREENLDLHLNTSARRAVVAGNNRISSVICDQLGTEKRLVISAAIFADCSGDGAIAYSAGAEYRMGREARSEFGEDIAPEKADNKTLGSSLLFRALDVGRPVEFTRPDWAYEYPTEDDLPFRNHERLTTGHWWIELGGENNTILDAEQIRDELWKALYGVWDHIKNRGDHGAENLALDWVGAVPGKRESRRFLGDYMLLQQDVESEARFPDSVAYGGWPIDLHNPAGIRHPGPPADMVPLPGPYAIPFRCLYSKNIENLMMAGRNISTSHVAFGTTRLQATGAVEGQAIGTAATLCVKYSTTPREVCGKHIVELQQTLLREDCYIPGVSNSDPADLARAGKVTASSQMSLDVDSPHSFIELDRQLGQIFPMSETRLETVSLYLRSTTDARLTLRIRKVGHWRGRSGTEIASSEAATGEGEGWISFPINSSVEPGFYWTLLDPADGVEWGFSKDEPICVQRTEGGVTKRLGGSMLFRTLPASRPYGPENVINGMARPESWTNIWISDPTERLPQQLQVDLPREVALKEVRITFDTDLDDIPVVGPADKCVKAYVLSRRTSEGWLPLSEVGDNHRRLVVHRLAGERADALRLEVLETWGSPSARIYEIRAYGD